MSNKMLKTTSYTDTETGLTSERQRYVDAQFSEDGYLFWCKKNSVKTFVDIPLPNAFTWAERGRLTELQHYMLKDNQLIVYRSHSGIKPIAVEDMRRIFEMSDRQCRVLIAKAKQHKIIKEVSIDGIKYFAYNPVYGFKGKRMSIIVFILFQEELKSLMPPWVVEKFMNEAEEIRPTIRII
jgi:hypothetical protein